ncbi:acetyl-CoA carboxylase carboxyl transferase subunit beta [Candidatus Pelagibacter sp.]|nr:acetyl-CoA carboxylase carboxyl transferase subunit beta [Candidatus Pelagibacter sp.]
MNWINKFKKLGESIKRNINKKFPTKSERESSAWTSCCKGPILKTDLKENLFVCPHCNKHHRISPSQRFEIIGFSNYEILKTPIPQDDPLEWVDTKSYKDRLKDARKKTNQDCAVVIAKGKLKGIDVTVGATNFEFIGGSSGAAETEAIIYGVQHAIDNRTPFIFFPCGGGQRMFESPIALAGMTKTTLAINELKKNNLPYLVCFTDPTAGGITASFAMLGDIQYSEPGALIAFAGRRVVQATVKEELPSDFQTAEFLLKHGFVDRIVERKNLGDEIGKILSILLNKNSGLDLKNNEQTSELSIKTREAS